MKPNSNRKRDIGFYVVLAILILSVIFFLTSQNSSVQKLKYSDVRKLFQEEKVDSFTIEDNVLKLYLKEELNGSKNATHELLSVSIFYEDLGQLITEQMQSGVLTEYDYTIAWTPPWWVQSLPFIIVMILIIVFWFYMMNKTNGGDKGVMKFGKARTRLGSDEKKKVTFNDVAGAEEEKEELQEIVDFLKDPQKYIKLGARIPKGVLLVGPPGTGKTLLAKAVAGEAGVQFLSISGSDFVELYVGVGASRVRDLFDQAKKIAPAIIFIDEIDAVGRQRGAGLGGGHDEREQTLNQLLVEMDGFTSNEGVIVMAATNRADILDNALLRPGRFDRQIYVGLPDIKGREAILKVHARNKALGEDVRLEDIAKSTIGFTGADLENLLNEAALLSARHGKRFITMQEMDDAMLKVIAGPEKKSRVVTEKERKLTAYHEAGHAVAAFYLDHADPVHHITIIPRGMAGGVTVYKPKEDKSFNTRSEMFERIVSALGGRIAEKLMLDDISTGASEDIRQASGIARSMVTVYGMSEKLGPISYDSSDHSVFIGRDFANTKSYSEKVAALIDDEVKHIFDTASLMCEKILTDHKNVLIKTAEYLLAHETMDGEIFTYICEHDGEYPPEKPLAVDDDSKENQIPTAAEETEMESVEAPENEEEQQVPEEPEKSEEEESPEDAKRRELLEKFGDIGEDDK